MEFNGSWNELLISLQPKLPSIEQELQRCIQSRSFSPKTVQAMRLYLFEGVAKTKAARDCGVDTGVLRKAIKTLNTGSSCGLNSGGCVSL